MNPAQTTFILTDLETTGLSPQRNRVIEVALLKYRNGEVINEYQTLVNPHQYISTEISRITGIEPYELEDAPGFEDIASDIFEFFEDGVMVAHNINFDYLFLRHELERSGVSFHPSRLCTVQLSRKLFPQMRQFNLDAVMRHFGFTNQDRHRAMGDVHVLRQLFDYLLDTMPRKRLSATLHSLTQATHTPARLKAQIDKLPNTSGVYFFYDSQGKLLYIGKSITLRQRVLSHFQSIDQPHYLPFQNQVTDIEYEVTAGDLSAQLLEAKYIKEKMPIYNRQLRRQQAMVYAYQSIHDLGYMQIVLSDKMPTPQTLSNLLGVYRSRKQAKQHFDTVIKNYNLCDRLFGLEKGNGPCFGFHLKRCHGACAGKESNHQYNLRFNEAFQTTRIKNWPYTGTVALYEQNEEYHIETIHFIDHWCYLGSADSQNEITDHLNKPRKFDYDQYKILLNFLFNSQYQSKIKLIN